LLTTERAIHFIMFVLLVIGLFGVSAWAGCRYVSDYLLKLASIALSWGIILMVLYVIFERLDWNWWH
jgi:hypothetical protein